MKLAPLAPMPWDMVVFLTITTVGFGYSVQRVMHPDRSPAVALPIEEKLDPGEAASGASSNPTQTLDLGCLEERRSEERISAQEGAIRLKGEFCQLTGKGMRRFDGMTVRNVTTGFEGTIFFKGYTSAFVTDFMRLQTGRNVIQVEWRPSADSAPKVVTAEVYEK